MQILIEQEEPVLEHASSRELPVCGEQENQNSDIQWVSYHLARSYLELKAYGDASREQRESLGGAALRVDAAALSLSGLNSILSGLSESLGESNPALNASLNSFNASLTRLSASLGMNVAGGGAAKGLKVEDVRVGQLVCVVESTARYV
jgi:hypothetical protein